MTHRQMRREIECECVRRLLAALGRSATHLDSPNPPAPDVRAVFADGSAEAFEVTEIHPDEVPGRGSAARSAEAQRAKRDPYAVTPSWIQTEPMPGIRHRLEQKVKKAAGYSVQPHETLSLLLVGSLPQIGAVAATFIVAKFLTVERLNAELNGLLAKSPFQRAYLHLPLSGSAVWAWSRPSGWLALRTPDDTSHEGRQALALLRSRGSFGPDGLLPGTMIFGRRLP
jgi:hypothetical protein